MTIRLAALPLVLGLAVAACAGSEGVDVDGGGPGAAGTTGTTGMAGSSGPGRPGRRAPPARPAPRARRASPARPARRAAAGRPAPPARRGVAGTTGAGAAAAGRPAPRARRGVAGRRRHHGDGGNAGARRHDRPGRHDRDGAGRPAARGRPARGGTTGRRGTTGAAGTTGSGTICNFASGLNIAWVKLRQRRPQPEHRDVQHDLHQHPRRRRPRDPVVVPHQRDQDARLRLRAAWPCKIPQSHIDGVKAILDAAAAHGVRDQHQPLVVRHAADRTPATPTPRTRRCSRTTPSGSRTSTTT